MAKVGLVEALVWNKQTGNLVGGHQRIGIMDDLEGTADYLMDVCVIDVDLAREKEINVFLNNTAAMGTWDLDLLAGVLREPGIDRDALGFDPLDLQIMFDGAEFSPLFDDAKDGAKAEIESLETLRAGRKAYREKAQKEDDPEFMLVLVFDSRDECEQFAKLAGLDPTQRYVDGRKFATQVGVALEPETVPTAPSPETVQSGERPQ